MVIFTKYHEQGGVVDCDIELLGFITFNGELLRGAIGEGNYILMSETLNTDEGITCEKRFFFCGESPFTYWWKKKPFRLFRYGREGEPLNVFVSKE